MTDPAVFVAVLGTPLALAMLLWPSATRQAALALAPWAALPGLALATLGAPVGPVEVPWLLLGSKFGLDDTRRVFLLLTAGLWLAAGVYAAAYHRDDPHRVRLFAFHLAALAGNLGLVVALDAVSFYLFFILMSLAAFGLVIHSGTEEARRAAVVYLVLVLVGETLVLPGLWLAVGHAPSTDLAEVALAVADLGAPTTLLLAAGFAVKAGAVPLHVWLPLAHPVAPTPASAVLSGAMIKAGLLGWIVFLPLGVGAWPGLGVAFVRGGVVAALFGVAVGLTQTRPKSALAYSSVSQMGYAAVAIGIALAEPHALPAALAATLAQALHHGLAKGALFLGVGVVERAGEERLRRRALYLLLLPALALAGAPPTSGLVAKTALKTATGELGGGAAAWLDGLPPLAAVGTTLLMARVLWLLSRTTPGARAPGLWPPWLGLLAAVAVVSWLPLAVAPAILAASLSAGAVWSGTWPVAVGAAVALWALGPGRDRLARVPGVPEGDLLWPVVAWSRPALAWRPPAAPALPARLGRRLAERFDAARPRWRAALARADGFLSLWPAFGIASLLALLIAFVLLNVSN